MSDLYYAAYNPDVLSCLANLSNDEVFTPPEVANAMLDMLPQELFSDPKTTFLDPGTKSGVFLREIVKRLLKGLEDKIPDLQTRLDHIMHEQVFGIAITEMTSLLARRSIYCSKYPNSKYSVSLFNDVQGNIRFKNTQHVWQNGKCAWCGASKKEYKRAGELETHAYEFIHTKKLEEIFGMKFDVIIGNPPYQLSTANKTSQATALYNRFVEQAKKLRPKYMTMIIPSRWMNGGFGLDSFREIMIKDKHIRVLHDFFDANDCFPGITLSGGVCYFLWDRDHEGKCQITTHLDDGTQSYSERYLLEDGLDTFVRNNEALSILKKVQRLGEQTFDNIVSQRDPFGLNYFEDKKEIMFKLFHKKKEKNDLPIYYYGWQKDGLCYADKKYVTDNFDAIDRYKVMISKANGAASAKAPYAVLSRPFVAKPQEICNMTYLMIGPFEDEESAKNACDYVTTKFFRFLVSLLKNTQNAYKKVYKFVPLQDFSKAWTDDELYAKYGLTADEIAFIDSMIKPMDLNGGE